MNYCETKSIGN